jgi:hypothetical protein
MHFRSETRGAVVSNYPMVPYSNGMYSGGYGFSVSSFLGLTEAQGWYVDTGGYGWYYNGDTNKSLDLVFAPGGGKRVTYYVSDPNYQTIFNKVVKGKNPVSNKEALKALVEKSGGVETTGKSVASSSAAGSEQAARATTAAGGTPAPSPDAGGGGDDKKFWEQSWFLPAAGAVTVAAVLAIALWPSPKAKPLRTNRRRNSRSKRK